MSIIQKVLHHAGFSPWIAKGEKWGTNPVKDWVLDKRIELMGNSNPAYHFDDLASGYINNKHSLTSCDYIHSLVLRPLCLINEEIIHNDQFICAIDNMPIYNNKSYHIVEEKLRLGILEQNVIDYLLGLYFDVYELIDIGYAVSSLDINGYNYHNLDCYSFKNIIKEVYEGSIDYELPYNIVLDAYNKDPKEFKKGYWINNI